jgi:hypothetical protein
MSAMAKKYEETFEFLPEHLTLLRHANLEWSDCEFGAPAIDPKRPYGNSSVVGDIVEILGKEVGDCKYEVTLGNKKYLVDYNKDDDEEQDEIEDKLRELHYGTLTVLEIIIHTGTVRPGLYGKKKHSYGWELIPEGQA